MFACELADGLPQFVKLLLLVGRQVERGVHGGSQLHSTFAFGKSLLFRCVSGLLLVFGQEIVQLLLQFQNVPGHIYDWSFIFGFVISGPFVAVARLFEYVDARTRREGWDIQVRFNAIAQRERKNEAAA